MNCSILIVWLDANANDSSFHAKLTNQNNQQIQIFTEVSPCITCLQEHSEQTIFFVLSGSFGSRVVPLIYDCKHILQIYLFCASIANHRDWALDYADKILMFDHEDDLLQRLFSEIEQYFRQQAEQYFTQANICKERAKQLKQGPCG